MKMLQELVRFRRLEDENDEDTEKLGDDNETSLDDDMMSDDFVDNTDEDIDLDNELSSDEFGDETVEDDPYADEDDLPEDDPFTDEDGIGGEDDSDLDEPEDPNRQGLIRAVKGAHLVYKRSVDDGAFEELWIYNVSTLRDEITIRKAILAGTDIPVNKAQSPDGSQSFETWSAGNAELMLIKGLQQ